MVDGIGGTTWDGSLLLMHFLIKFHAAALSLILEEKLLFPIEILEVGGGCGVVSLLISKTAAATRVFNVTCTDREKDLIEENMKRNNISTCMMNVNTLDWGDVTRIPTRTTCTSSSCTSSCTSSSLHTNEDDKGFPSDRNRFSVIYGAEIVVLNKQHDILIDTVEANANDDTLILFTFDELCVSSQEIMYKKQFLEKMSRKGYKCSHVMDGEISWLKSSNEDGTTIDGFNDFVASIRINEAIKISRSEKEDIGNESLQRRSQHHLMAFFKNESSIACCLLRAIV